MNRSCRSVLAFVLAAVALPGLAAAQHHAPAAGSPPVALNDTSRVRKWRQEVAFITSRVRELHPRPFTHCPERSFDSAATAITARIATTDDARLAVECMRMVALLRDGHTAVIGTFPQVGFRSVLPVAMRPFHDGIYVAAAGPEHAALAGAKVTRIGELSADDAMARVATATNADNRFTELDRVPLFMMMPAMYHVLGVTKEPEVVPIEVERAGGKRETVTLRGGSAPEGFPRAFLETEPDYPKDWISARKVSAANLPRCDVRPAEAWWIEHLPESKMVYLRMRRIDPVSAGAVYFELYRKLFATVDSLKPRALVIDLRHDHGGNNTILDPLIRGIVERPWLNREGALFALIDRGTFSAAMNAAVFLDERTDARFIGEPTGGRVNHYGDANHAETPNFQMICNVSTVPWLARFPQDGRPYLAPEIATPWTFASWRDGKDLALDAAADVAWNGTLPLRVLEAAKRGGPAAGKTSYDAWVKERPNPWSSDLISQIVTYGSDLGQRGDWSTAVTLGEAAVLIDPRSALAWRVLGEAHLNTGNRARAVECLRKTLEISPRAQVARLLLERMGEKMQ